MLASKNLTWALCALIVVAQWSVWFDKGGWFAANEQKRQAKGVMEDNRQKEARNAQLRADVNGLQDVSEVNAAVEERARFVLGMVSKDERFVQITAP